MFFWKKFLNTYYFTVFWNRMLLTKIEYKEFFHYTFFKNNYQIKYQPGDGLTKKKKKEMLNISILSYINKYILWIFCLYIYIYIYMSFFFPFLVGPKREKKLIFQNELVHWEIYIF